MTPVLGSDVAGKAILITGATSGIGRGVAIELARRGARVVATGRRVELGEQLVAEADGDVSFVAADITDAVACHAAVDATVKRHGRIDAHVNNAGGPGDPPVQDVEDVTPQHWQSLFDVNVAGTFFCSQRAIHHMRTSGGGSIVNVASTQAVEAVGGMGAYNAAKAAVVQLGRSLAVDCMPDRIRVNTLLMGGAATEASAEVMRQVLGLDPGADFVPPTMPSPLYAQRISEIGAAVSLLCSDAAKLITGATIALDRAMSAGSLFSAAIKHAYAGGWDSPAEGSSA